MGKIRLDQLLVERGLAPSRTAAAAMVMAGEVSSEGRLLDKPGREVPVDIELVLKDKPRYVSRAGGKLASVAEVLDLDFEGKTVLDVGSSTGGFTDFALQRGASKVFAVDVGTGQLADKLRRDPRVESHERTDIRELPEDIKADMAVVDVSFISLKSVLESVATHLNPGGLIVAMAKPQFEAGKALADKYKGVIPEPERTGVLEELEGWLGDHFTVLGKADSAVAGTEGNLERFYVLYGAV
jgi:23S rRNA (cytidine1920-2'-O)/16S rRNA (cytidine1409-2'-O)-methyltransferase